LKENLFCVERRFEWLAEG